MDTENPILTESPEIIPEVIPPRKPVFLIAGIILGLFIIITSSVAYGYYRHIKTKTAAYQNTPQAESDSQNLPASKFDLSPLQATPTPQIVAKKTTASPTPKATMVPKTTPTPTPKPTPTPTPVPIADFFAESIVLVGGPNHTTTLQETSSLAGMKVDANFRNNARTEGVRTVQVKVFYDGVHKTDLSRAEYGDFSATFSYQPPIEPGTHTVRLVINDNRAITETNYNNNEQSISYTIIGDSVPPTFSFDGPYQINNQTCMHWINLSDNVFTYTDVWAKWKIDDGSWSSPTSENPYGCVTAISGSTHTYTVHAEDLRGNVTEKSQSFTAY